MALICGTTNVDCLQSQHVRPGLAARRVGPLKNEKGPHLCGPFVELPGIETDAETLKTSI